jgi:hypothetical protein
MRFVLELDFASADFAGDEAVDHAGRVQFRLKIRYRRGPLLSLLYGR